MLVLHRKAGESLVFTVPGSDVEIEVVFLKVKNGGGQLGVVAPSCVKVLRKELLDDGEGKGGGS